MTAVVPPRAAGAEPYEHVQAAPATVWTIPHGLGRAPAALSVYDSGGSEVWGDVDVVDEDTAVVTFTTAFGGKALVL